MLKAIKTISIIAETQWNKTLSKYGINPNEIIIEIREQIITQEETVEQLEQLRWLKSGWRIGAQKVNFSGIEINTPEDAERWNETL